MVRGRRAEGEAAKHGNGRQEHHEPFAMSAGAAIFARLKALGVDYVFCNSGTDFPPIIEGLAEAAARDVALPQAVVIPHEHAALSMAHGYYFATGKAQAVMLHTNVGLANGAIGAINAATDQIPVLMMSGRTPVVEQGRFGARTVPISWGQEMRDQAALVREACKWDYELRFPEQIPELLDRAHAIANSLPKGPVYLSLPREVLCEPCPAGALAREPAMAPATPGPAPEAIARAAALLARAERPVVFAQRGAGGAEGFGRLAALCDAWSLPVCQWWAVATALPTDHPMYVGTDPEPWVSEADVILVLDSLAPWAPDVHKPRPDARIIQLGPDPLFARFPVRHFRADITIACDTATGIAALESALAAEPGRDTPARIRRRRTIEKRVATIRAKTDAAARPGPAMTKAFVARCLSQAIAGRNPAVFSELGCPLDPMTLAAHDSWHQEPHSGGLGWSFPCALGMQLADRDRLVVATMGDGSYMFANPVACHQIAEALELPVLVVVLNNGEWSAVRHSVLGLYPDGHAAKANVMPLTSLSPSPDFRKIAEASRGYATRVERAEDLAAAFQAALAHIAATRTQALVDVKIV